MLSASIPKQNNVKLAPNELLLKRHLTKPLSRQKFYLDVKNRTIASKLETKIKELGGIIELFLVKDVKGLITDRENLCGFGGSSKPTTSNSNSNCSPFHSPVGIENDKIRPKTRADAMLAKAKVLPSLSSKDPLEDAKKWGVSILSVEKAFTWLDKIELSVKFSIEKTKSKVIQLKAPFIKFETFDRKTRPVFQEIPYWPSLNLEGERGEAAFRCRALREPNNMTRNSVEKKRVVNRKKLFEPPHRRPPIELELEAGYCEVCRLEYSYLEEHLLSEKHQTFVSDPGNFKQLDDLINDGRCNIDSFIKLTRNLRASRENNDNQKFLSPTNINNKMPRVRTTICDANSCNKRKYLTSSETHTHNLRTRSKNNSLLTALTLGCEDEVVLKPVREARYSTRSTAVPPVKNNTCQDAETWSSGRPKRSCIKQKRISADERLVFDNKNYYRVEVLSNKLRSSAVNFRPEITRPPSNNERDKGLIVKFRKMRYSELARLNDEAENFLFPRRDLSSSGEDGDIDNDNPNSTESPRKEKDESSILSSELDITSKIKNETEEDHSMDSSCSDYSIGRGRRKRRTQAEAFIADNQKYYKFEMPGSRLRYQGSYLSPIGSKNNGERLTNDSKAKEKTKVMNGAKINLEKSKFSFEFIPKSESWYEPFHRQDCGEEIYANLSDSGYWKPLILPYQMGQLPPVDPRICLKIYNEKQERDKSIKKDKEEIGTNSLFEEIKMDGDVVNEGKAESSRGEVDKKTITSRKPPGRRRKGILLPSKNPRKSPRQHASTLAILSGLIQQRKRREIKKAAELQQKLLKQSSKQTEPEPEPDYDSLAKNIDEVLTSSLENLDRIETDNNGENFKLKFEIGAVEMLEDYAKKEENCFVKANVIRRCGRKKKKNRTGWPNKNKKAIALKNKEEKEENSVSDNEEETIIFSPSFVQLDSEEEEEERRKTEERNISSVQSVNNNSCSSERSITNGKDSERRNNTGNKVDLEDDDDDDDDDDVVVREKEEKKSNKCSNKSDEKTIKTTDNNGACEVNVNVDLDQWENAEKVLNARLSGENKQLESIVRVGKLEKDETISIKRERERKSSSLSPRRTNKRPRRMPASPKSPRILRKPRGRWYRERF